MVSHPAPICPYCRPPVLGTLFPENRLYRNICARPRALSDGEAIASHCRQVGPTLKTLILITDFSFKIRRPMARFVAGRWSWRVPWLACLVLIYTTMNISSSGHIGKSQGGELRMGNRVYNKKVHDCAKQYIYPTWVKGVWRHRSLNGMVVAVMSTKASRVQECGQQYGGPANKQFVESHIRDHVRVSRIPGLDARQLAMPPYLRFDQSYGAACVLASIDECDGCIIRVAAP